MGRNEYQCRNRVLYHGRDRVERGECGLRPLHARLDQTLFHGLRRTLRRVRVRCEYASAYKSHYYRHFHPRTGGGTSHLASRSNRSQGPSQSDLVCRVRHVLVPIYDKLVSALCSSPNDAG